MRGLDVTKGRLKGLNTEVFRDRENLIFWRLNYYNRIVEKIKEVLIVTVYYWISSI